MLNNITTGLFKNSRSIRQILIVIAVLGLSAVLAQRQIFGRWWQFIELLPLLIAAMIGGIYLIRNPHWGPSLIIFAALVVPFTLGTGTEVSINAAMLLLIFLFGLWLLDAIVLRKQIEIPKSPPAVILLMLCVAALLSFVIGQLNWIPFAPHAPIKAQLGGLALYFISAISFLLPILSIKDVIWLKRMTWLFLIFATGYLILSTFPGLRFMAHYFNESSAGSVFWIWIAAIATSQGFFNKRIPVFARIALIGITFGAIASRFFLYGDWISGWLPPAITILTVLLIGKPLLGVIATIMAGFYGLFHLNNFLSNISYFVSSGEEYSFVTRMDAWKIMGKLIAVNPITGLGPANYHFYTVIYPLRGYFVQFNSHNQYIDLLAQTGVISLFLFLLFFISLALIALRIKRNTVDDFEKSYSIGVIGASAGMLACGMLGDWVIPFVYNIGFDGFQASMIGWLFLGGLLIIATKNDHPNMTNDVE